MRTPVRLATTLFKSRLKKNKIERIVIEGVHRAAGSVPLDADALAAVLGEARRVSAPVVWIASESDPLHHAAIAKACRQLQDRGRFVFLETDGQLLRRRIHEFRPDARLFLTVRLHGMAGAHDRFVRRPGAFALALEGIRAAQLSGFFVCAHVVMYKETLADDVGSLLEYLREVRVDGVVITSAAPEVAVELAKAQRLMGSGWWNKFSRLAQATLDSAPQQIAAPREEFGEALLASEEVGAR